MSYAIGTRIRELRTIRQISQEQMAERLKTTRQRLSRLENGQLDVSYMMIKEIADYLGVSVNEITSAEVQNKGLVALFRDSNEREDLVHSVDTIERILRTFKTHEKLYYQMKVRDANED